MASSKALVAAEHDAAVAAITHVRANFRFLMASNYTQIMELAECNAGLNSISPAV